MDELLKKLTAVLKEIGEVLAQLFHDPLVQKPEELSMNQPEPPIETPTPDLPQTSRIESWALAIQRAEGGKPQDLNTRNKNPGNLKYTTLTASLGGKKGNRATDGGTFCYFDTYEQGFKALCDFLRLACTDKLKSYRSTMTLEAFTTVYALPPNKNYVNLVASRLDVPITIQIKELL